MGAEARSVVVRLSMEAAQYIAQAQKVGTLTEGAMVKAEKATLRQSAAMDTLGAKSGKAALVAGAGLAFLAKSAVDFESQFAGVEKTVDGTASELAQLETELRGLATTMPATHQEILGVAEAAGQLGVAREDITDFTATMVELGATTNLTAQDAATAIAQMANVMGTAPEEIDRVGSALVALGNDGASTEAQILGMAQRIAGAGAQIGLAESDILAIANAASSMGIEVEAGGSAISRVFTELAKATAQGGANLEAFASVAGVTATEFARAFEEDPARAFAAFTGGLDRINKSGGDVFTTLDQLGLSDVRVSQALLGMAASGDLLTDSLALGAKAWDDNSALSEEYAKRLDTTASDAKIAWNQIKDAGIEAGTALLPILSKAAGVVGDLAGAFKSLPDPVQDSLTSMLAITAVLGGGLWFGAKVIGSITSTRKALQDLAETSPRAAAALGDVGKAGAAIAALELTASTLDKLTALFEHPIDNTSGLSRELRSLADGHVTDGLQDLSIWLDDIGDKWEHDWNPVARLTPLDMSGFEDAQRELGKIDTELTSMVAGGKGAEAAAIFKEIADRAKDQGTSLEELTKAFPEYQAAVDDAAASATSFVELVRDTGLALGGQQVAALDANAEAWDAVVRATAEGGSTAGATAKEINQLTQELRGQASAALSAFDATTSWGAAVIAAREQVKTGEKGLDEFTEAGQHNRTALSQLAAEWANQSNSVKNNVGRYKAARATFLEVADAMGVGSKKAREMADEMLHIPKKIVAKIDAENRAALEKLNDVDRGLINIAQAHAQANIDADNAAALRAIAETNRFLGTLQDKTVTITTAYKTVGRFLGVDSAKGNIFTYARGGMDQANRHWPEFAGPGPTRMWREPETGGESYIPHANDSRRPRAKSILEQTAGMFGGQVQWFATGGIGSAASLGGRSAQDILDIAEALAAVRDLRHQLAADGKERLSGLDRRIAELRLRVAEQEYRVAKKADAREDREKARDAMREERDRLQGIRSDLIGVGQGFSLDSLVPGPQLTVAQGAAAEIAQFKADIIAAGGVWTSALKRWARDLIATAAKLDEVNAQLAAETKRRDELIVTLNEQQAALDQLNSTMQSFSDQVASNFLDSPFNQTSSGGTPSPELAAAQAELAAIRASATGDSPEAATRAEQLSHQIAQLGGGTGSLTGLAAFDAQVAANTAASEAMLAALQTLRDKGLDVTGSLGGLFEELARSGDLATATQLAELSAAEIDAREKAFANSQTQAATVAAFATQARYGVEHAELVSVVQNTTAAIATADATMAALQASADSLGGEVRDGAADGVAALQPQFDKLAQAIDRMPHRLAAELKKLRL